MTVTVHLSGPRAEGLTEDLELGVREVLRIVPKRAALAKDDSVERGDPVAVAALVLSIPGALLASIQLAERARLGERLGALITRLRERAGDGDQITLVDESGRSLDLLESDGLEVLDRLEDAP